MSIGDAILATLVVVLGGAGTFLMLPHRHGTARPRSEYGAGAISASVALLLFVLFWSPPGPFLATLFFYVFSLAAIIGGLLTITSRNPIHSALWFASVVLSTAGLFLLAGAPFLAAGTVIVYAGAIIVTFLFVIMLAQSEGKALYDRSARSPGGATLTCYLLLWCLIYALSTIRTGPSGRGPIDQQQIISEKSLQRSRDIARARSLGQTGVIFNVLARGQRPTSLIRDSQAPSSDKPNVAGLGGSIYTDHLVTAGIAGALLFVALIAAVSMTNPRRPGPPPGRDRFEDRPTA
jgi:NADH-quinone oxidoreductase subunit J